MARDQWPNEQHATQEAQAFYRDAMTALQQAHVPFLVGGGYAFYARTGIARMTKDLDLFLLPEDVDRALEALAASGYETELTSSHWLAKAFSGKDFIDIIFNSGNGCCPVDERWFEHATDDEVMGVSVRLCPPEENIWQKAFIMERERYDGADVAHLFRACGETLDWDRLIERFGDHWRVLLAHLVLFSYIFPDKRSLVPDWVIGGLTHRLRQDVVVRPDMNGTCYGTLLSRKQYETAVTEWGYDDARVPPVGGMNSDEAGEWTAASDQEGSQKR
jgi:hypothetical protein